MSLSRLALRLAAIEALCPAAALAAGGPYPTIAGPRVEDSRIDLLDFSQSPEEIDAALNQIDNKPLLVVYTEEQDTSPYGEVKYPAAENIVTLVIEAMIGAKGEIQIGTDEAGNPMMIGSLDAPVTSRQHEATLDLLESQVRYLLIKDSRAPSAALWQQVAWEIRRIHSDPQRDASRTIRLAARTIKFHVKVGQEVWPVVPATGLPKPLSTVAAMLPAGSSGAVLCAALAAVSPSDPAIPAPPTDGGIMINVPLDRAPNPVTPPPADVEAFVPPPTS